MGEPVQSPSENKELKTPASGSPSSSGGASSQGTALRGALRGTSYDAGVQMLQPRGAAVQMKGPGSEIGGGGGAGGGASGGAAAPVAKVEPAKVVEPKPDGGAGGGADGAPGAGGGGGDAGGVPPPVHHRFLGARLRPVVPRARPFRPLLRLWPTSAAQAAGPLRPQRVALLVALRLRQIRLFFFFFSPRRGRRRCPGGGGWRTWRAPGSSGCRSG